MNYLAHFHLAWPDENLVAGGLEGDYHKGPLPGTLPPDLLDGVRLHRAIDGFTDRHPLLAQQRQAFPEDSRRYAGILMDLCFDYFLTRHWDRFCDLSQRDFSEAVYVILSDREASLSAGAQRMAGRLAEYDVLMQYAHWDTVIASAGRIGQRLRRANPLHRAEELLEPLREELEATFLVFYPELQRFSADSAMLAPPSTRIP